MLQITDNVGIVAFVAGGVTVRFDDTLTLELEEESIAAGVLREKHHFQELDVLYDFHDVGDVVVAENAILIKLLLFILT